MIRNSFQKIFYNRFFLIFLMGTTLSLLFVYALHLAHIPYLSIGEPGKYIGPAKGFYETGHLVLWQQGHYIPALWRLPGYPLFLALNYLFFGMNNVVAVLILQCLLMGGIVLAIALSIHNLTPKWVWPAAMLTAFCPNLAFRAAMIMPDLLFAFFIAWGLCALITALQSKHTLGFLVLAIFSFVLAFYVRPAFLLYPVFTVFFLPYLFRSRLQWSVVKSCGYSFAFILLLGALMSPQFIRMHHYSGHYTINLQGPDHLLYWVYPCLSTKWGGKRNLESFELAKQKLSAIEKYYSAEQVTITQRYNDQKQLAESLIKDLPFFQIFTASVGSSLKLLMYTSFIGILEVFHQSVIPITALIQSPLNFFKNVFTNPWFFVLFLSQGLLILMRILQLIGVIYGLKHREIRGLTLYLLAGALSFVVVSVSIGNPRYRVPMEPILVLFSVFGLKSILENLKNKNPHPNSCLNGRGIRYANKKNAPHVS